MKRKLYTEEDIQTVIRIFKIKNPKKANREGAIEFLEELQVAGKDIAHALMDLAKTSKKTVN
ncbi:hypothetical protein HYW42_05055 [Candidatus Daviesbacteria bacterium]|nr:hypothetical protein [Candidatus Daviesbacteria bacterium]